MYHNVNAMQNKNFRKQDQANLIDIRVPHSREAERALLAALIMEPDLVPEAMVRVRQELFFIKSHKLIFDAIVAVIESGLELDLVTLYDQLERQDQIEAAGGRAGVSDLLDGALRVENIDSYISSLEEAYWRRAGIAYTRTLISCYMDATVPADEIHRLLIEMIEHSRSTDKLEDTVLSSLSKQMSIMEDVQSGARGAYGLPTGYRDIDKLTGGLQPGNLIIIAARPSIGKSALAVNIADNVADMGKSVGIISLEMTIDEIAARIACGRGSIDYARLRDSQLSKEDWRRLAEALQTVADCKKPIMISDRPGATIGQIGEQAYRWRGKQGLDLLIVDHAQLARLGQRVDSRAQEVGLIARELKGLAKQLDIPIILLSQLNRNIEHRKEDDEPRLSDLKESGGLEENADIVAFIHRDRDKSETELIFAKHRNGKLGRIPLHFNGECMKFESMWREM